jgi:hypothetical protein
VPQIDRYRIVFYGSSTEKPELKAKIELYQLSGEAMSSVGKVRFHSGALPADEKKKKKGLIMNLPSEQLGTVVELLRTEKPVYFAFHEGRAVLGTGVEPVGSFDETNPQLVRVMAEKQPEPPPKPVQPSAGDA